MRIENLTASQNGNAARISATFIWEERDHPSQEIYFQTPDAFADYLSCSPHPFLVGGIVPAMRWGEKRIAVPEPICPELREGLMTAMEWLALWHGPPRTPVRIESPPRVCAPLVRPERAASFLSGGVDSLATLRINRLAFPREHPRSIRDCLFVHGFDIGARREADRESETYDRALRLVTEVANDAGASLVPVLTNVRYLDKDVPFWIYEFYGAAMASVAHALASRISCVSIATSHDIHNVNPVGSHPLLDPNFGCSYLQVRHDGVRLSRLEKVRLVAGWEVGLQRLRVCTENPPGQINCGRCPKCVRTMMELLAVGKLASCAAFPEQDVSRKLLSTIDLTQKYDPNYYGELVEPLKDLGRDDLVEVIECKIAEYYRRRKWVEERDWKGAVKRFDRRFLRSGLYRSWKTLRPHVQQRSRRGAGQ
jgi:hypothetical protein